MAKGLRYEQLHSKGEAQGVAQEIQAGRVFSRFWDKVSEEAEKLRQGQAAHEAGQTCEVPPHGMEHSRESAMTAFLSVQGGSVSTQIQGRLVRVVMAVLPPFGSTEVGWSVLSFSSDYSTANPIAFAVQSVNSSGVEPNGRQIQIDLDITCPIPTPVWLHAMGSNCYGYALIFYER